MQLTAIYITCHISKICYIRGQLHHNTMTGMEEGKGRRGAARSRQAPAQPALLMPLGILPIELNSARMALGKLSGCRFLGICTTAQDQQGKWLMLCFNVCGNAQAFDRGRGRMKTTTHCSHPGSCNMTGGVTTVSGICTQQVPVCNTKHQPEPVWH